MLKNCNEISRIDLEILCPHKVDSRANDIFIFCVKKIHFSTKIGVARDFFFCLFTQDIKKSVFCETWRVHIEYRNVGAKFCSEFFDNLKLFFSVVGAYALMSRMNFSY
jgi:hypothetical protein